MLNLINDQKEKCNKHRTLRARTIALYHAGIARAFPDGNNTYFEAKFNTSPEPSDVKKSQEAYTCE
jgi:hypothetical protein